MGKQGFIFSASGLFTKTNQRVKEFKDIDDAKYFHRCK